MGKKESAGGSAKTCSKRSGPADRPTVPICRYVVMPARKAGRAPAPTSVSILSDSDAIPSQFYVGIQS